MSQANTSAPASTIDHERQADYLRRLRAAGIDPAGEGPADMDEFRRQLARKIHMFVNTWHGCPERICRRNHGCMAPDGVCANVAQLSPEEQERQWREVQHDVYTTLKACLAKRGLEDA